MGIEVHCAPAYYQPMRDLNEDSSSSSWPASYGNTASANGHYHGGFMKAIITDGYIGCRKDALKQKMLEHEAIFKSQVYELHRLYRIQRDMMEEFKMKEQHKLSISTEPSSSSTPIRSKKWQDRPNPSYEMMLHSKINISPVSCTQEYNTLKLTKRSFDLQLPAHEYIDTEESSYATNTKVGREIMNLSLGDREGVRNDLHRVKLADLNEPFDAEECVVGQSTLRVHDSFSVRSCVVNKIDEAARFSQPYQPGSSKSIFSLTLGLPNEKMPIPSHPSISIHNWLGSGPGPGPGPGPNLGAFLSSSAQIGEKWLVSRSSKLNGLSNRIFGQVLKSPSHLEKSKPVIDIDLNEEMLPCLMDLDRPSTNCEGLSTKRIETHETQSGVTKLMGFPVFETGPAVGMVECAKNVGTENLNRTININLECDPNKVDLPSVDMGKKEGRGPLIDLNEEYDALASIENSGELQLSQAENEALVDESLRCAAEIMVDISSCSPLVEPLMWLAGQLEAHGPDVWAGRGDVDDFEAMTLQIEETKEYVPTLVAREEAGRSGSHRPGSHRPGPGRPRRGEPRRGRQHRRDFQQDILPGLTSLSRPDVSEDMQIFGELMQATGHHHWAPGLERRKGGAARGRRRAAHAQVEDGGLRLKGWGVARRPRRQRCPARNDNSGNCSNRQAVLST